MDGSQIQLLERSADGKSYIINKQNVEKLLEQNNLLHRKLIVISIVGKYRTGKTYFLNQIMKFLRYEGDTDWMQKETTETDFIWSGGDTSLTKGITCWSHAFPFQDEYAVILMDSEGNYDQQSSAEKMSQVFGCSALSSSILIYNVSERITQQTLQEVEYFSEYGSSARECGDGNPFQKLLFLVRDWEYPVTCPFGFEGGEILLSSWMADNKEVSETIQKCFKSSSCYLMPHPGDNIADAKQTVPYEEMDAIFRAHLQHLIEFIFSQDMLQVKSVGGKEIFLKDFPDYFNIIAESMTAEGVTISTGLFQNQIKASNMSAQKKAQNHYLDMMNKELESDKPYKFLRSLHEKNKESALQLFSDIPKIGGNDFFKQHNDALIKDITSAYDRYKERNENLKTLLKHKEEKDDEIFKLQQDMMEMKARLEKENKEAMKKIEELSYKNVKLEQKLHEYMNEELKQKSENETKKDNNNQELQELMKQLQDKLRKNEEEIKEMKEKLEKAKQDKKLCIIS